MAFRRSWVSSSVCVKEPRHSEEKIYSQQVPISTVARVGRRGPQKRPPPCRMWHGEILVHWIEARKRPPILGTIRWPQRPEEEEQAKHYYVVYGKNVLSAQLLGVSIRCKNGAPAPRG